VALDWWHVLDQSIGFRVKDYTDFKSCQVQIDPLATDQPLVEIPTNPGVYQLTKRYQVGALYKDRPIYKPVTGTIVLSGAGTVDYTTGQVTGSAGGTWGGEFDLPMRFSSNFPVEIIDQRIESVSFTMQELRRNSL